MFISHIVLSGKLKAAVVGWWGLLPGSQRAISPFLCLHVVEETTASYETPVIRVLINFQYYYPGFQHMNLQIQMFKS